METEDLFDDLFSEKVKKLIAKKWLDDRITECEIRNIDLEKMSAIDFITLDGEYVLNRIKVRGKK